MTQPRAQERLRHRFAIRLTGHQPVVTEDVSEGGFAAVMVQPLEPGQRLSGTITFGELTVPFEGHVAWIDTRAPIRQLGRFGVRFASLPESLRHAIAAWQRSLLHRNTRAGLAA